MLTIRLEKPSGGYESASIARYSVDPQWEHSDGTVAIKLTLVDDKGAVWDEYIGDNEQYKVAYVSNDAGKTIDRIGKRK